MKKILLVALVAILVGVGIGYLVHRSPNTPSVAGSNSHTQGGFTVELAHTGDTFQTGLTSNPGTSIDTSGNFFQNTLERSVSVGSCAVGTTTLFALLPPSGATSTAMINFITSSASNATSSQITVGTSTVNTGLAASGVSGTFANALTIATSSDFRFSSGIRVGSLGQLDAGVNSYGKIMVGPTTYLSAFATSTYSGSGSIGYIGGLGSSCTYKITWDN